MVRPCSSAPIFSVRFNTRQTPQQFLRTARSWRRGTSPRSASGTDARSLRSQLEKHPELTELEVREIGQSMVQVSGLLRGEPDSLIKTLSHYTIHDLTLEEPDLEESVLELYESTVTPS